jgi:hypothetical protein
VPAGLLSNSSAVVSETFRSPLSSSSAVNVDVVSTGLVDYKHPEKTKTVQAEVVKQTIKVNPTFKLVFIVIVGITVLAGVADIFLAAAWPTPISNRPLRQWASPGRPD